MVNKKHKDRIQDPDPDQDLDPILVHNLVQIQVQVVRYLRRKIKKSFKVLY
jgi:hypothetical protein